MDHWIYTVDPYYDASLLSSFRIRFFNQRNYPGEPPHARTDEEAIGGNCKFQRAMLAYWNYGPSESWHGPIFTEYIQFCNVDRAVVASMDTKFPQCDLMGISWLYYYTTAVKKNDSWYDGFRMMTWWFPVVGKSDGTLTAASEVSVACTVRGSTNEYDGSGTWVHESPFEYTTSTNQKLIHATERDWYTIVPAFTLGECKWMAANHVIWTQTVYPACEAKVNPLIPHVRIMLYGPDEPGNYLMSSMEGAVLHGAIAYPKIGISEVSDPLPDVNVYPDVVMNGSIMHFYSGLDTMLNWAGYNVMNSAIAKQPSFYVPPPVVAAKA